MKPWMIWALAGMAMSAEAMAGVVTTRSGPVDGVTAGPVEAFKGIPYAAPPLDPLRWRAPQPVTAWKAVRKADEYGSDCMQLQPGWDRNAMARAPGEDCLYLNIWRPTTATAGARLPVMVWIHGGAFTNGGSSLKIYDGTPFAEDGVIFVSLNYRMGRFGFFGFPELTKQDKDKGLLGNYGYMDQIAALKWVRDNIAAFGGDPERVTIFGESAGGGSVLTLLTSPESRGLYARAIVQSGGGRQALMGRRSLSTDGPGGPSSETLGVNFARRHNIQGTGPDALDSLRALPSEAIVDGLNSDTTSRNRDTYGGPMVDGRIVRGSPSEAFEAGLPPGIPIMIGVTSADMGFFSAKTKAEAFASFGDLSAQAKTAYDPDGTLDLASLVMRIGRDRIMAEPARYVARVRARHGFPSYHYRFSYVTESKEKEWTRGVPHFEEVNYVFKSLDYTYGDKVSARDRQMADITHQWWVKFAKGDLTDWPAYDPNADIILDFQRDGKARLIPDPDKAQLDVTAALTGDKVD